MSETITVFAMGQKGYAAVKQLTEYYGAQVFDKVIYATDKNVINDYSADIIRLCKDTSIPCYSRTEHFLFETRYSIAISWRWLIHTEEPQKIIVFHDSLLPKYRGFAPLVSALINGDNEIGVTALFATKEFDRGEIIGQKSARITYPIKVKEAIEILADLYAALSLEVFALLDQPNPIVSRKQNEEKATYSVWRNDDDYSIDWKANADYISRFIDAVSYPFMGASSMMGDIKIRILDSEYLPDVKIENRERHCGKVLFIEDGEPVVICGTGLLKIKNAVSDSDRISVLPLTKFRVKFG